MWHDPLLFCSVTSHTQRVAILNAKLCNPSLCVFSFFPLSVVFSFRCSFLVFVQTWVCYVDISFSVLFGGY